ADDASPRIRHLIKRAGRQAALWPGQNHLALVVLFAFGFFVFLNCTTVCLLLPGLMKTLLGIESIFSRSVFSMLNTTFFTAMFGLTYLCIDPIVKALYALRCFYGESLQSGEDLKAELRQVAFGAARMTAGVAAVLLLTMTNGFCKDESRSNSQSPTAISQSPTVSGLSPE